MFQCLIQFHDGQNVFPPSSFQHFMRLHTLHESFKAMTEAFLENGNHTLFNPPTYFVTHYWFASSLQPLIYSHVFLLHCSPHSPLFSVDILTWIHPFSYHLSFFSTHTVCTVCIKRPVIHHRVRAECSPCCTPVFRLLYCQPSRAKINHPNLRHYHQRGPDRDRRERERHG